jgi:tetraacyldisaccharide 4'-kinase
MREPDPRHPGLSALAALSSLYGAGVAMRFALYRSGFLHVRKASRPVISVGNVAAGGTGKTPFIRWLAGELSGAGQSPSILTRGYGRDSRGAVVVSNGAGALSSVRDAGDEAALLARALPRVPIVADARRVRGAALLERLAPATTVHLLDDGFSHVALAREVDIVLIDATAPDAGGALLPAGRLREPLASLARANLIVITKVEQADHAAALHVASTYAPGVPVYSAVTEVLGITDDRGLAVEPANLPPGTVLAVAGIARPDSFWSTLDILGIEPTARLPFRDHARYGDFRIGTILRTAEETGATALITTEKDAIKLEGRVSIPIFRVGIETRVVEKDFLSTLLAQLTAKPS